MQKRGFILIIVLAIMGMVVIAQDNTPTPPLGPIPLDATTPTNVPTATPLTESEPIVSTPTLVPANGESVQVQGPLSVIDNVHAAVAPFTSVIKNPTLAGEVVPILVNGRVVEVPPEWSFTGDAGLGALPPHILRYEGEGLRFGWDYVNGRAGFAQDGIQLFGNQRYIVRVNYQTDLIYTFGNAPFTPSHHRVGARIYTAQGGFTELPLQPMRGTMEHHEQEWVIESTTNPYPFIRLEVYFITEYPIFIGSVALESINLLTAPADYRPQFVINFD